MTSSTSVATLRRWLCGTSLMATSLATPCIAQTAKSLAQKNPVVAQPVPVVSSSTPVVRSYRETLARLFDEPPTFLSLAGFIAARYTFEVLSAVAGPLTRESALAAFQKRSPMDVGGFRVSLNQQCRSSTYITQTMMTLDGRLIG